jgi:hypothetical protein
MENTVREDTTWETLGIHSKILLNLKGPIFWNMELLRSGTHLQMNRIFAEQEFWLNSFPQLKRDVWCSANNYINYVHYASILRTFALLSQILQYNSP